jgi:hypothetical protein
VPCRCSSTKIDNGKIDAAIHAITGKEPNKNLSDWAATKVSGTNSIASQIVTSRTPSRVTSDAMHFLLETHLSFGQLQWPRDAACDLLAKMRSLASWERSR